MSPVDGEFNGAGVTTAHTGAGRELWSGTDWRWRRGVVKDDVGDTGLLVDLGATGTGVLEEKMVEFGASDVPSIVGGSESDKVGVCGPMISMERGEKRTEDMIERQLTSFLHVLIELDGGAGLEGEDG